MDLPITLTRRDALVLGLAAVAAPPAAGAADIYPSRPVTMVAPSGAGGPIDVYTRAIADELRKALHQTFTVKNEPGAGTTIGTNMVAKAVPDGYTLLMVSDTQTVSETLYAHRPYQLLRDLTVVAPLMQADLVLVVNPSVQANNLQEFLALARDRPGRLNYGSVGYGSSSHMAGELLKQIARIDILHLPDRDSSDMLSSILNGQTQILFDAIPTMAPIIKSGLLRALATGGTERSSILPNVPTFAEAGVDFQTSLWVGFMAPQATPQPIIDLLNRTIVGILSRQDIKDAWQRQGATPMLDTREEFTAFIRREIDKWARVIQANHMPLVE
jgi:tripartite-type tricarboxylate transporter receptor subunit TctC